MSSCVYLTAPAFWSSMKHSLLVAASCQIVPAILRKPHPRCLWVSKKEFFCCFRSFAPSFSASFRHLLISALAAGFLPAGSCTHTPDGFPSPGLLFTQSTAGTARQTSNPATECEQGRHNIVCMRLLVSPCYAKNISSILLVHSRFIAKKNEYSQGPGYNSKFNLLFNQASARTLCSSAPLFLNPCFIIQVPQLNINLRSWKEGGGEEEETFLLCIIYLCFCSCWILFSSQQWLENYLDCAVEWNSHFSDEHLKSISYEESKKVGSMLFKVKNISAFS